MPSLPKGLDMFQHPTPVVNVAVGDQDRCELARRLLHQSVEGAWIGVGLALSVERLEAGPPH